MWTQAFHDLALFTNSISFLATPLSSTQYPPPLLQYHPSPSTRGYPSNCRIFSSLAVSVLGCCTCWSLCREQFLHPTHPSASSPKDALSIILETVSSKKPPWSPKKGQDILPGHLYLIYPRRVVMLFYQNSLFVCLHHGSWAVPSTDPVTQKARNIKVKWMNAWMSEFYNPMKDP